MRGSSRPGKSMTDPLQTSAQMTLWDTSGSTSSPESADGIAPSSSPDGPPADPCGQDPAPASHSALREKAEARKTSATYGRRGFGSSASAALQSSLANRLMTLLDGAG